MWTQYFLHPALKNPCTDEAEISPGELFEGRFYPYRMKAKQTITASVAFAAVAAAWATQCWRKSCLRQSAAEQKLQKDALDTFEGEGGTVLS